MSAFKVGQKVRIVRCFTERGMRFVGREAVIVDLMHLSSWDGPLYGLDISPIEFEFEAGWCGWGPEQLEPITDANDLVSWESMRDLWVPDHMREAVA